MITHQEYMNNSKELFRLYWSQYVTDYMIQAVKRYPYLWKDQDPHFNGNPISIWDKIAYPYKNHCKKVGNKLGSVCAGSLSDAVCAVKTAAKIIRDNDERLPSPL